MEVFQLKRSSLLLIFLYSCIGFFSCNAMELLPHDIESNTQAAHATFENLSNAIKTKFNNFRVLRDAFRKIKLNPVTTITAIKLAEWINKHQITSGIIATTVLVTSIYGSYKLIKITIHAARNLKKPNTTLKPTKTQTADAATSTDESVVPS